MSAGYQFPMAGENLLRAVWWARTWACAYQRATSVHSRRRGSTWRLHKHEKEAWSRLEFLGGVFADCFGDLRWSPRPKA